MKIGQTKAMFVASGLLSFLVSYHKYITRLNFLSDESYTYYSDLAPEIYREVSKLSEMATSVSIIIYSIMGLVILLAGIILKKMSYKQVKVISYISIIVMFLSSGIGFGTIPVLLVLFGWFSFDKNYLPPKTILV